MITRGSKTVAAPPRKDFLNAAQRKELGRSLKDKLTKGYGLDFPGFVAEQVDAFLASQQPVNSKTLGELEAAVKRGVVRLRAQPKPAAPLPPPAPTPAVESRVPSAAVVAVEPVEVEDEITLYREEIARQEAEIDVKRRRLMQTAVRAQLSQQMQTKKETQEKARREEESYAACQKRQAEEQAHRAAEIEQRAVAKKAQLLSMQNRIIEERRQVLESERRAEQEADLRFNDCLREELCRAKIETEERAAEKRTAMSLLMQQNEEWKRAKEKQEEENRREEANAERLADQIAKEEEAYRTETLKLRNERINSLLKAGEGTLKTMNSRKNEEEERLKKFAKKQDELLARRDDLLRRKQEENKQLYKQYLAGQIAEKENIRMAEKARCQQQADFWATDAAFFADIKQRATAKNVEEMREYKSTLEAQISEKAVKKQPPAREQDQQMLREDLRAQLEELRETKALVDAQLNLFK